MASYNHTTQIGNLTRDPELRTSKNGKDFVTFGIAVNEKWDGGERVDYFEVIAFNGTAKAVANLKKKGDPVLVEGKLRLSQWKTEAGENRSQVKIEARNVQFLHRAPQNSNNNRASQANQANDEDYDDIPF